MGSYQTGILDDIPLAARHLFFTAAAGADIRRALSDLRGLVDGHTTVVGVGLSLALALGREVPGLRSFPSYACAGLEVPSTPSALWCWLRAEDRGQLIHSTRQIERALRPGLRMTSCIDAFRYQSGLDLSGYEDGTENPKGPAALDAAIVTARGRGQDGSSFVAIQQWVHDMDRFDAMTPEEQDRTVGRRKSNNEELEDAPPSAHVKRTAQESFHPEAFVWRRSMPWSDGERAGLVFVAFGKTFDAFEAQLRRMVGAEDGISDALFQFTRPVTGSYFWCPPASGGRLDLSMLGL